MGFLRLGVACAIMDEAGCVVLIQRGDLGVHALPGGRLDSGETLREAAAREAREETGLVVHIERAVNLYYLPQWHRLNVMFAGIPVGGELRARTQESRNARFFRPNSLPTMAWNMDVFDALSETRPLPRHLLLSRRQYHRVRWQLRLRWLRNLLTLNPEPRFARFDVRATALMWNEDHTRVLTLVHGGACTLPRVFCDGSVAPWDELKRVWSSVLPATNSLRWTGVWQDPIADRVEFVFATTLEETEPPASMEWSATRNAALGRVDQLFLHMTSSRYHRDPIWLINTESDVTHDAMVLEA